jgi:hypothetical protein
MNDLAVRETAFSLAHCNTTLSAGGAPTPVPEVIRTTKGRFPADLNQLRGHLSLEASVGEPVVVLLECGRSAPLLIAACDDKEFYGTWNVEQSKWTPVKSDQLYGPAFSALIQNQISDGEGALWVASFLVFPPVAATEPAVPAVVKEEVAPASAGPAKKKVIRKRPATAAPAAVEEGPETKKAAPAGAEADDTDMNLL